MIQREPRLFSSVAKVYKVMPTLRGTFLSPTRIERTLGQQATTHSRRAITVTRPIIPYFTKVLRKDNEMALCAGLPLFNFNKKNHLNTKLKKS